MIRFRILAIGAIALMIAAIAASAPSTVDVRGFAAAGAGNHTPATLRRYGETVALGGGKARTYVTLDATRGAALEIGVALDERALDDLPSTGSGHHQADGGAQHAMPHTYLLDLPAAYASPFTFVELNWNPAGHEPEGVYQGAPHFDFHFYTITRAEREAIVPGAPDFAAKANAIPTGDHVPPYTVPLGPPGVAPAGLAVPKMGVHWSDVRSPELQALLGNPEGYAPFTATFIHGSWDGRFIFWEPMITRAHLLAKRAAADAAVRDEVIAIPTPARYQVPGRYPAAYRITWDADAREYRIALTQLAARE